MEKLFDLTKKSLVIVFAYAPTGLGHLRVTDALYHGLPENAAPLLLGSQDKTLSEIYRLTSIHRLASSVLEFFEFFAPAVTIYKKYLRSHTNLLYGQLLTILDERLTVPETVVLVATHFGLAQQLGAIKGKIEQARGVKVFLFVQVTDDSPHPLWYVEGADIIFVPSFKTKKAFQDYAGEAKLPAVHFQVSSYPVTPTLTQALHADEYAERREELDNTHTRKIHFAIPVSGAAIGTNFIERFTSALHAKNEKFHFHIMVKDAFYTQSFIKDMKRRSYVELATSTHDRGTVDAYEEVYKKNIIALEMTKPSEQTFKVLCSPKNRGGAMLLLAPPVGKWEFDNLNFLHRHNLIPLPETERALLELVEKDDAPSEQLLEAAKSWRALILPQDKNLAVKFVLWCLKNKIFYSMAHYELENKDSDENKQELSPEGVQEFWESVSAFLKEQTK